MPYILPHRHRFAHDYAIFLHDLLVHLVRSGRESGLFNVEIDLLPQERVEFKQLEGEALYHWIEARKGRSVTAEMDYRSLIAALVGDLCHFTLEGLRAATKGKLTVAYALFRKPFKDDLFFLEWLLADREDFLTRFQISSPDSLDFGKLTTIQRLEIVVGASIKADAPGVVAQKVFDVRFDRHLHAGLAASWDQAIHLVTTWNHNRTSPRNLNFIFSGPEAWESQWANLYWMIPYLLYYTTFVVDRLISSFVETDENYAAQRWLRRAIGYELWAEYTRTDAPKIDHHPSLLDLLDSIEFKCPHCRRPLKSHRRNLRYLVVYGQIRCETCKETVDINQIMKN